MTKEELNVQIDKLILRIRNKNNSVFILQPIVQDIYQLITGNKNFWIENVLPCALDDGEQNCRREPMVQLLETLKEQMDLFVQQEEVEGDLERKPIGY